MAVLDEYDIAYLKWDHNRDLVDAGSQVDDGSPTGAVEFAECLLTGAALHHVGLSPPIIDPEQLILFRIDATGRRGRP